MKKIQATYLIIVSFFVLTISCSNNNAGSCDITLDENVQNLSGGCTIDDPSHVRIEGLSLPIASGQSLTVYYGASSNTSEDGIQIVFSQSRVDITTNGNTGTYQISQSTVCVDVHDEDPDHILVLEGGVCDQTGSSLTTVGNSETTSDVLNGMTGNPNLGSFINYKGNAELASTIRARTAIFEE